MLARADLIKDALTRTWHVPIMRVLSASPKRYGEIRAGLSAPGSVLPADSQISAGLAAMRSHGLVEQRDLAGTRRHLWALTPLGTDLLQVIEQIERPSDPRPPEPVSGSGTFGPSLISVHDDEADLFNDRTPARRLSMDEMWALANKIDTSVAHPARRYNWLLGGKDNFEEDRKSGMLLESVSGSARVTAVENRQFLKRAVAFVAEAGIDQFLDIGTGLPTADNTHEVAQRVNPRSRVVYVDNDPMVLAHARALLTSTPEGRSCYIEEDLRNPDRILGHPEVRAALDFDRPVALMLVAVLHFIESTEEAYGLVRQLIDALPSGSYLVASHMTVDFVSPEEKATYLALVAKGKIDAFARSREECSDFFAGLELADPRVVPVSDWRSPVPADQRSLAVAAYGAVGRKP